MNNNPSSTALTILVILSTAHCTSACFTSIFNFGDSLSDTGNALLAGLDSGTPPASAFPPYGRTFFHRPTGRFSDGRLVLDFIAQRFGLPLLPPYMKFKNKTGTRKNLDKGVNFAYAGGTVLDASDLEKKGVEGVDPRVSLRMELDWFREVLPWVCGNSSSSNLMIMANKVSDCREVLSRSLMIVGGGGNDYGYGFGVAKSMDEVRGFVPSVVAGIASAVGELIELGAENVMVTGCLPFGCCSAYLTRFMSSEKEDYDATTGCLNFLKDFTEYHNKQLRHKLDELQELHPRARIIFADFYNASMCFYRSPISYGFRRETLTACCGANGPYNYNASLGCGYEPIETCDDPSQSVSWDGVHLTESAYKWIADGLLEGPYTTPPLSNVCVSVEKTNHAVE